MRQPLYKLSVLIFLFSCSVALCGGEAHGQSDGPFEALTWHDPSDNADLLSHNVNLPTISSVNYSRGQNAASEINKKPEGRRGLFAAQLGIYIAKDGWVKGRDNPNDRIIASTLDENISGASRTSITVAPLNFSANSGEKIWIQTGDPSNVPLTDSDVIPAYLTADAAEGATTLSIDDGGGNPVTITASSGDRVLSNTQSPWIPHATEEIKQAFSDYMQGFVDAGGQMDVLFLDQETSIPETIRMSKDPRWDDSAKGINGKSLKQVLADSPYTLQQIVDAGPGDPASNWTASEFTGKIMSDGLNEALFNVAQSHFPNLTGSDYGETGVTEANKVWGTDANQRFEDHVFGTHGSHPLYASIRGLSGFDPSNLGRSVGKHPFAVTKWQMRYVRGMLQSTGKVMPWLTFETLIDSFFTLEVRGTPYYEEHLRHMALHTDSEVPVLYFNARDAGNQPADDQQDENFNSVLVDLNSQVSDTSYTIVSRPRPAWGSTVLASAIETSNKRLWRVTVRRVLAQTDGTLPQTGRDITVNVSNGDTITIPSGEVGAWYETATGTDVTFSYQHPPVDNILPSDDYLDLTSAVWSGNGEVTAGQSDPDGGTGAYKVKGTVESDLFTVPEDGDYALSVWVKRIQNSSRVRMNYENGDRIFSKGFNDKPHTNNNWVFIRVGAEDIDSSRKLRIRFPIAGVSTVHVYQPMLNRGLAAGPYASPEAPSPGSQQISLQKGGNLVSAAVDPTYPDLETVLGDATSSIARIETQDGQVFDPSEGIDEIGTWDPSEAYSIYAEEPTSFVVGGTILDSKEVSLDAGWNWLPHLGSTSVPVDQAFDTIQNDLVMVKDEAGRIYRPAQGTDQIGSLQPGTAYKILLENPVVLSYPLE